MNADVPSPQTQKEHEQLLTDAIQRQDGKGIGLHYFLLLEHHPESELFRRLGGPLMSTLAANGTYDRALGLWRTTAMRSTSARVLANAGAFLENEDPNEAFLLLKRAYAESPRDQYVVDGLGRFYAEAADRSLAYRAGKQRFYMVPVDFGLSQAARLTNELETLTDPALLATVAKALTFQIKSSDRTYGRDPDARAFGFRLYDRAQKIEPQNPKWSRMQHESETPFQSFHRSSSFLGGMMSGQNVAVSPAALSDHLLHSTPTGVAHLLGLQGDVRVQVKLDLFSRVQTTRAVSGNWLLRDAAVRAVMQWEFARFYRRGTTASVTSEATVRVRPA